MTKKKVFKRKLYNRMLEWKNTKKGSSALLIEGARRVGKSTLAESFAKQEYKSYILIDFAKASKQVFDLFNDISDLNLLFNILKLTYNTPLYERNSVIIFDEIQLQPKARQAIKHLVADGRYDYIETGSLISIKKNIQNILIPSEETRLTLNPMDFEEFRWALGDEVSIQLLRESYSPKFKLGEMHREMMRRLRLYILIGGMPQAVNCYLETNDLHFVDEIKREILNLYEEDFNRIDPTGRVASIFKFIPAQLSKKSTSFKPYAVISRGTKRDAIEECISELEKSKCVNICYHSDDPNVGFALTRDYLNFKLFLADTGLFITLAFADKNFTENVIYQKLLSDKLSANLGYVYENLIAQMLKANGHELFYYTFNAKESSHTYEIDFLISNKDKICPIEVKSSSYKSHTSIDEFSKKFSSRISNKYLIHTKDFHKEENLQFVPTYATILL